jgi:mRNA (guanine-N7-)-methyltransferase
MSERVSQFYHQKHKETREERESSPLISVRKFNNFIKSVLISEHGGLKDCSNAKILDLCGGTGGDFPKFQHLPSVSQVVLVDISPDSVAEAERRYISTAHGRNPYNFSAILQCGNAFSLPDMQTHLGQLVSKCGYFDMVNCQFALQYAFKSPETASEAFEVISYYLKPGGKCVATIPNAQFILDNLSSGDGIGDHPRLSRPPYFEIEFCELSDGDYVFSMGDCVQRVPEWLAWQDTFQEAAEKWGLVLKLWCPFKKFFDDSLPKHYDLAIRQGCLVDTLEGMTVEAGAWICADLYVAIVLGKNRVPPRFQRAPVSPLRVYFTNSLF